MARFCVSGVGSLQSQLSGSSEKGRSCSMQIGVGGRRNLFTEPSLGCWAPAEQGACSRWFPGWRAKPQADKKAPLLLLNLGMFLP